VIKGLFTSGSGMIPQLKKQEATANNLANSRTTGYKKDALFVKELSKARQKVADRITEWQRPMLDDIYTDYTFGNFDKTGNPLDLAIDGEGFFTLQLDDGTHVLSRAGSFTVNNAGQIEFPGGALLVGEGGPIPVGEGQVEVGADGQVFSNGALVGRITPVTVADLMQLEKLGNSMFLVPEGTELLPVPASPIQQGYLEASNVDVVREMVEMIIAFRNFEANARSLQAQEQSLEHLFNRVAGQ